MTGRGSPLAPCVLLVLLTGGCGASLPDITAAQTGCRASEITILEDRSSVGARSWVAECRGERYQCASISTGRATSQINCSPEPDGSETRASAGGVPEGSARAAAASTRRPDRVERVRGRGGDGSELWVVRAHFESDGRTFQLAAAPAQDATRALLTIAAPLRRLADGCPVGVLVDGELHRLEVRSTSLRSAWREYELVTSMDLVRRWGTASRVVGRICDDEWRLEADEQAVVNEFVTRIDEELVWLEQATSGGAAPAPDAAP